jgi:hypothetical protein
MRTVVVSSVGLLLGLGSANATTYQLTYTGHKMVGQTEYGEKPIRGVKHFSFVVQSTTPFPKSACVDIAPSQVVTFTDGVDTPTSLTAAGYVVQTGNSFSVCTDGTGKKLVSWKILYAYIRVHGGLKDYYDAGSIFPAQSPDPVEDLVYFALQKRTGGGRVLENINTNNPGKWKYQVLD